MNHRLVVTLAAAAALGLAVAIPATMADSHSVLRHAPPQDAPLYKVLPQGQELPPECVNARIVENSGAGPTMWVQWCGTGSAGEPPMDSTTFVTVDGGPLTPKACTKANPCVVVWPASPPS